MSQTDSLTSNDRATKKGTKAQRCWWCNKKLMLPHFAIVKSDQGDELKVHKDCKDEAVAFWKPITAAVRNPVYTTRND